MLSDAARLVLEGASVAGDPFEPDLAASAAGVSEASAVDALDELLRSDLVRVTDVPRRFRFRHPIVRRAVYEATPGGWRLGAHERAAGACPRGARRSPRAHTTSSTPRVTATLPPSPSCARPVKTRLRARPRARPAGSPAALRLLPATAPAEDRVALLFPRAQALAATGQFAREP